MAETADLNQDYPAPACRAYVLGVLLLAYVFSFIDRNVLAMLVGPIREQFAISDFQYSILHGWAFTLFYIVLGLPIGRLADRYSRRAIITLGVLFWSLMTCACGFARSFGSLFLARVGVGVGEAALSPPTYSLLGDYFPPDQLRWATAIFAMGITIGSGVSYVVGGYVYEFFAAGGGADWPLLGGLAAWQLTFISVGLPGLLIVALLLLVREPVRRAGAVAAGADVAAGEVLSLAQVGGYLRRHWQVYTALIGGVSMMSVIGYGTLTWYPEFLQRSYGLSRAEAGAALGWIFLVGGSAGTLCGAVFADGLQRLGYTDANMRLVMLVAMVVLVPAVAGPLSGSADMALWLAWPVIFLHYTHFGVAMAALTVITPNRLRAQVSALMLFMTNLFGLALGGSFVAFFTDYVYGADTALNLSLATVAALVYPAAAVFIGWGLRYYRRALAAAE